MIGSISKRALSQLSIVSPATLLAWQKMIIAKRWKYKQQKPGRKSTPKDLKKLILEMKQDNQLWGCQRIADELKKLDIAIHHTTVNRIIQTYRKECRIKASGAWRKFLKAH